MNTSREIESYIPRILVAVAAIAIMAAIVVIYLPKEKSSQFTDIKDIEDIEDINPKLFRRLTIVSLNRAPYAIENLQNWYNVDPLRPLVRGSNFG